MDIRLRAVQPANNREMAYSSTRVALVPPEPDLRPGLLTNFMPSRLAAYKDTTIPGGNAGLQPVSAPILNGPIV